MSTIKRKNRNLSLKKNCNWLTVTICKICYKSEIEIHSEHYKYKDVNIKKLMLSKKIKTLKNDTDFK